MKNTRAVLSLEDTLDLIHSKSDVYLIYFLKPQESSYFFPIPLCDVVWTFWVFSLNLLSNEIFLGGIFKQLNPLGE